MRSFYKLILFRYINNNPVYAKSAYIGLALPGDVGSWQYETKVSPPFHVYKVEIMYDYDGGNRIFIKWLIIILWWKLNDRQFYMHNLFIRIIINFDFSVLLASLASHDDHQHLVYLRVINFGFKQMRLDTLVLLMLDLELITCILGSPELLEITNTIMTSMSNKVLLFFFSPFTSLK